jgi:heat-inducible transcriptional repressor
VVQGHYVGGMASAGSTDPDHPTSPSAVVSSASARTSESQEALDSRKAAILRAVVNEHIETGQPVGSAHVSESAQLKVSSATVRNEMSALEREGYLTHPHTSAGRIPTDRGYRYFVDGIAKGNDLTARSPEPGARQVQMQVHDFFERTQGELGRLLDQTTRVLSDLTDHTAVLISPTLDAGEIRSVQLVGLGPVPLPDGTSGEQVLLVTVLAGGAVDKAFLQCGAGATPARLAAATAHLSGLLVGRTIRDLPGVTPRTGDSDVDRLVATALEQIRPPDESDTPLLVGGAARVADSFDALQTVRSILSVLEEQYLVVSLLRETARMGTGVSIGGEHGADAAYQALVNCSVVVAPYRIDGRVVGSVGVLGPTRMNYPQVISAVEAVSERLSDKLSDPA